MAPGCELCEAARFTHWYSEDSICWVADCEACNVPMVVWHTHGVNPTPAEQDHMETELGRAADQRFGHQQWRVDADRRSIPDHFHLHARDDDWFRLRDQRYPSVFSGVGTERVEKR